MRTSPLAAIILATLSACETAKSSMDVSPLDARPDTFVQDGGELDGARAIDSAGRDASLDAALIGDASPNDSASDTSISEQLDPNFLVNRVPQVCYQYSDAPRYAVFPMLPEEAGYVAAARLPVVATATTIDSVQYELLHSGNSSVLPHCSADIAHTAFVYVIPNSGSLSSTPSASGQLRETLSIPASGDRELRRRVTIDRRLTTPIALAPGEQLVIAVQLNADATAAKSLCFNGCNGSPAERGTDFWGESVSEPFLWADLVGDHGFPSNLMVRAHIAASR